jgi:hypothetical protein
MLFKCIGRNNTYIQFSIFLEETSNKNSNAIFKTVMFCLYKLGKEKYEVRFAEI